MASDWNRRITRDVDRRMKRSVLVVLITVLAACTATPEGASTSLGATSTSTSTPTLAPTTTTTTLPPTTTTLPPTTTTTTLLEGKWAEQPVIASGSWVGILGWWNGQAWAARSQGVEVPIQGDEDFQTVGTTSHGRATATGVEVTCEWIEPGNLVLSLGDPGFIPTPAQGEDYEGVAISAPWALQPRSVVENPSDGQHVEFASDVLAGMGLEIDQPLISQILIVDLDGDGVLEKLVTAQDSEIMFDAVTEGYSVVFLRRLVGGAAVTSVVEGEAVAPGTEGYPRHRAITGVADLNGDGRMEVVLSSHQWESGGITVYELQGDQLVRVLGAGCGV
jgi:hypothetical protein